MEVPTDLSAGAPSRNSKRAAKCTLAGSPQCPKMQERFLLIQTGIQDERDDLLGEIKKMQTNCDDTKDTLQTQIADDESTLGNAQTKLAAGTEKEANAGEQGRQSSKQFEDMNGDLKRTMSTCSANYITFETELCALKKILGEIYKMKGGGKALFVDCSVTKWEAEECDR